MKTAAIAAMLTATLASPVWAEAVVVSSTAPGLALGQVVADGASVALPEDATATFLLSTGQVMRLVGPYQGPVSAQQASGGSRLALLDGHDLSALGGVRGTMVARLDDLKAPVRVDAMNGGTYCLPPDAAVTLVRSPSAAAELTLTTEDGRAIPVRWRDGATEQLWPAEASSGRRFTLTWAGEAPRDVQLQPITVEGGNDAALITRMASAGCGGQAVPLLRAVGEDTTPLALWLGTERGRAPRYAPGEEMTVVLQTNRDAHLYCYGQSKDGLAAFTPSGLEGGFAVPGHTAIRISGRRLPGGPPELPGEERALRCWAVEADVSDRIPLRLAASRPEEAARKLGAAFDSLRGVQTAEARLVLRVE